MNEKEVHLKYEGLPALKIKGYLMIKESKNAV